MHLIYKVAIFNCSENTLVNESWASYLFYSSDIPTGILAIRPRKSITSPAFVSSPLPILIGHCAWFNSLDKVISQ